MRDSLTQYYSRAMLIALAVTLAIHLSLGAGVIWGGWLESGATGTPAQPREVLVLVNLSVPVPEPKKIIEKNSFVPVDLKAATPEPPKENTPLNSNANSQAAQKKPARTEQPRPFIDDQNDLFPNSFNQPPALLNPAPTATQTPQPQKTSPNPAATVPAEPVSAPPRTDEFAPLNEPLKPADVLGKPIPLETNTTLPGPPRAPTLAEADKQASRKIKPGGDTRKGSPSPRLRLTGYGDYDARFVDEVQQAWLRYRAKPGWFHPGKVVIDFKLHHNGAISDLVVRGSSAKPLQDYYGRQALMVPAPFTKWSETMRREIGADFRQCQFLFHYLHR